MLDFKGQDILDGAQFIRDELEHIMFVSKYMRDQLDKRHVLNLMERHVMGTLFFEPSTRTRLSFETAMHRLGGSVVGFSSASTSSSAKGESLVDTVRTVDQYVDVIVMRHPQLGSAQAAAEVADAPVINGGDGAGQHPTQALLDLFTIQSECGQVDGNTIALCGDLKHGRTVHAGVELYKHYDCKLILVAPDLLKMPHQVTERLRDQGIEVEETSDLQMAVAEANVLYMTRIQKERFEDSAEYDRLKGSYVLTREMVEQVNPNLTILHPLPRVNEISTDVDDLPGAAYFRQAKNGVCVRMALIALVTGRI